MMETVLTLSVGGLPPLSAKGCEQILKPIQLGQMKRTVNGELLHLGQQELKYHSTIKAKDRTVLACNGLCPGIIVHVGCIQPLWEKINNPKKPHTLMRNFVQNTIIVMDELQNRIPFDIIDGEVVIKNSTPNVQAFVCYRPILTMRVTDFLIKTNEWTFESAWELMLEEL